MIFLHPATAEHTALASAMRSVGATILGAVVFAAASAAARDLPLAPAPTAPQAVATEVSCDPDRPESETECLRKLPAVAARQGDVLRLQLEGGKTKIYKSNSNACTNDIVEKCIAYRLVGYYPKRRLILVHVGGYEGAGSILLISQHDGRVTKVAGVPRFSPSGAEFAVWYCDDDNGCGFEIWSAVSVPPSREWLYPGHRVLEFEKWRDDGHILVSTSERIGGVDRQVHGEITRANGGWELSQLTAN